MPLAPPDVHDGVLLGWPCVQAEAAKAAELKGPHTFSLPRLLQVYASLLRADENHGSASSSSSSSSNQQDRLAAAGGWLGVQTADVLMGVNSLVAARLMTKVSHLGQDSGPHTSLPLLPTTREKMHTHWSFSVRVLLVSGTQACNAYNGEWVVVHRCLRCIATLSSHKQTGAGHHGFMTSV